MKNPAPFSFLRSFTTLFLLLFFIQNYLHAQNPTSPDTTMGLETFNGQVKDTKVDADGKILVGGSFTYYKTTPINRLARLHSNGTLDNSFNIGTGADNYINSIAIQADGKIIIGGGFTSYNGVSKNHLVRLNSDGSPDNSFNIGTGANSDVNSITIQADGKIIIGGFFTSFNGVSKNRVARLNFDGSLDNSFNIGTGASYIIYSTAIQADGKIIIGGYFTSFNGISKNYLARLNSDGSLDNSFNIGTGASYIIYSIAIQADGQIIIGGDFTSFNGVSKKYLTRLNSDGSLDNSFNTGTGPDLDIKSISIQADGQIIIGGSFLSFNGVSKNYLARLNADGSLDNSFNSGTGATGAVLSITIQSDGKIIIAGNFTSFSGILKSRVARLNTDGSLDNPFNIGRGVYGHVNSIAIQEDGKIIIVGSFISYYGVLKNYLARLNADGSLDNSFNIGTGANNTVYSIAIQADGKIIIGGAFIAYNGVSKNYLARLNSDGSLDNSFNIGTGASYFVRSIAIQADGKIIIGGSFTSFNGVSKSCVARLNADGSLDNSFNIGLGANYFVNSIAIQADGKIIIGGDFTSFNGISKNYLARLNSDGSLDNSFNIGTGTNAFVNSIAIQADGRIIIGGYFTSFNGVSKNYLTRLNSDGPLDNSFNIGTGTNAFVNSIAIQADGRIIIGGYFTFFNGVSQNFLARLNSDGSLDNAFNTGTGANSYIISIAIQADGKIIVGGNFNSYQGLPFSRIVRLGGDPIYYNTIQGNIFTDANNDCNFQISENRMSSVIVKALPGPFYGSSDWSGNYQVRVDSGSVNYSLIQQFNAINSKLLINQCASSHNVLLTGASKDTCCFNFADSIRQCALLNISVQNTRMRRCFRNNTFVNYCNYGNAATSSAQIRVVYPSYIIPISSVPMWTSKQDSLLIYDLGTLAAGACNNINITDSVICGNESIRGLTQCIKATISPASNCVAEDPAWDRSSMKVTGACKNGEAVFTITNGGSGNMAGTHEYRVYVNDTLVFTGTFQLNSGQSFTVTYPSAGQTVRVEADQHLLHPGKSRPRATVENCGVATPEVRDLVTTAPQDDLDEETAITCNTILDSYDPNDKQTMPEGIGATNIVAPGTELEYTIRFQNTGTDVAYTVRVIDTLDIALDAGSFTQGASSHPYTLNISGKNQAVLAFNFYNINLPDSTTNKLASNGLVSFRITVPSNTTLGTEIKNKAHIFFDYNSAIITNETMHTVDVTIPTDLTRGSSVQVGPVINGVSKKFSGSVKIYPNPTQGIITVEIPEQSNNTEMRVVSLLGVIQKSVQLNNTTKQEVNLEGIKQGMYLYEIWMDGERKAGGMLQVK